MQNAKHAFRRKIAQFMEKNTLVALFQRIYFQITSVPRNFFEFVIIWNYSLIFVQEWQTNTAQGTSTSFYLTLSEERI